MPVFKDSQTLVSLFTDLWSAMNRETEIARRLAEERISVLFKVHNPDAEIYADASGLITGSGVDSTRPVVTLIMSGDTIHRFWMDRLNIARELTLRRIKTRGPLALVMKMLPLMNPGRKLYPVFCRKYGIAIDG